MVADSRANQFRPGRVERIGEEDTGVSTPSGLQQAWKEYLTGRFWILGALLIALSALALVQYRWIGQVAEAQRQRAQASLTAALSGLESEFDTEITRTFVAFQFPFASPDYSERYKAWLQHAPYPRLIRGVYIAEAERAEFLLKAVIPGEPPVRSTEWQRQLPELRAPYIGIVGSAPAPRPAVRLQTFSRGDMGVAFAVRNPEVTIEGNPAFIFPIGPAGPGATRHVTRAPGAGLPVTGAGMMNVGASVSPPKWVVIVLDAQYIRTSFLPRLVNLYFRTPSASDYEIFVVNRAKATSPRVVFTSESAASESQFRDPDGTTDLFELRLDCFSPPRSVNAIGAVPTDPKGRVSAADSLSEILTQTPQTCSNPAARSSSDPGGLWEVLAKRRAGSLDQAMATFRRRNLVLSGSVLLVLALGICMLVIVTERARSLAQMQAEFVLGMSHELRTPLTVIRLAADNLKKRMVENSEQAQQYGEFIHAQASELSNMIEETLMFARMRSTPIASDLLLISPEQIVKDALADCEAAVQRANIKTELDIPCDIPLVKVDLRLMKRCIQNLIENGIKYAARGGWIAIRAKAVKRTDVEMVEISVEDQGPGIAAADIPHIFEPFFRGKHAETSSARGVGLGLTLVKRVVEAHRGSVYVQNMDKGGVMFSIFLPANTVQGQKQGAA
jgi:signal transduction histidine kinase